MKIGKFIIRNAGGLRRTFISKLKERGLHGDGPVKERILQIYSCRILGLCIYRDEVTYEIEGREILKEASDK